MHSQQQKHRCVSSLSHLINAGPTDSEEMLPSLLADMVQAIDQCMCIAQLFSVLLTSVLTLICNMLQNARCLVKFKFSPKDSRVYEAKVPLYLGGNTARPYYMVDVRGEGQYPRLTFDTKECIMPPVPLGFPSRAQFYVISQGYDNLQLKACHASAVLVSMPHAVHKQITSAATQDMPFFCTACHHALWFQQQITGAACDEADSPCDMCSQITPQTVTKGCILKSFKRGCKPPSAVTGVLEVYARSAHLPHYPD